MSRYAFVWTNGIKDKEVFNHWEDGLRGAMRIIEHTHEVSYHEPYEDLPDVDWILYWEASCTHDSPEWGQSYRKVMNSPQKKALLFAGGPIKYEWVKGFDHVFVESKINKDEFDAIGVPNSTAFGVNTDIFKPMNVPKTHVTVTHGACAGWKRQHLVGEAMKENALIFGRFQSHDPYTFEECQKHGCTVLQQQSYEETARLLNSARVNVNCASYWGGGQRQTCESLACGIPVIVMSDSPKNIEYILESGMGVISEPEPHKIREAVDYVLNNMDQFPSEKGVQYIKEKFSHHVYAENLLKVIA